MKKLKNKISRNYNLLLAEFKAKGLISVINKFFYLVISQIEKYYYRNLFKLKNIKIIDNPFEVVEVPVDLINYRLTNTPPIIYHRPYIKKGVKYHGIILNGKWDKNLKKFNELSDYIAFKQRFIENKRWEETIYYTEFKENKINKYTKNSYKIFKNNLQRWDNLYNDIKNNGYKKQDNIIGNNLKRNDFIYKKFENKPTNEIRVCISRDGEIIHYDGKHRLAIAKILKIKKVPVIVNVWHKEFIDNVKKETGLKKITPKIAIDYLLKNNSKSISHTN